MIISCIKWFCQIFDEDSVESAVEELFSESDEIFGIMGGIIRYSPPLCNCFPGRIYVYACVENVSMTTIESLGEYKAYIVVSMYTSNNNNYNPFSLTEWTSCCTFFNIVLPTKWED